MADLETWEAGVMFERAYELMMLSLIAVALTVAHLGVWLMLAAPGILLVVLAVMVLR